eukprot:1029513-Pelagomonas_calceolata.AAC.1
MNARDKSNFKFLSADEASMTILRIMVLVLLKTAFPDRMAGVRPTTATSSDWDKFSSKVQLTLQLVTYKLPEHVHRVQVALNAQIDWAEDHMGHVNPFPMLIMGNWLKSPYNTNHWERKKKQRRQRKLSLHQLRKRRRIGSEEP